MEISELDGEKPKTPESSQVSQASLVNQASQANEASQASQANEASQANQASQASQENQENQETQQIQEPVEREELTPERTKVIIDFLTDLKTDPQADAFSVPVNWRQLGIPDYPTIVKNPMDLQALE